jgi:hypothetical protein
MSLQVTFNGIDYDENKFTFLFYKIDRVMPRSGPSDGSGGDIVISGQGFRAEVGPKCMLNDTIYEPVSVTGTEIRCPVVPALDGEDFFGNVDFAVSINGVNMNF